MVSNTGTHRQTHENGWRCRQSIHHERAGQASRITVDTAIWPHYGGRTEAVITVEIRAADTPRLTIEWTSTREAGGTVNEEQLGTPSCSRRSRHLGSCLSTDRCVSTRMMLERAQGPCPAATAGVLHSGALCMSCTSSDSQLGGRSPLRVPWPWHSPRDGRFSAVLNRGTLRPQSEQACGAACGGMRRSDHPMHARHPEVVMAAEKGQHGSLREGGHHRGDSPLLYSVVCFPMQRQCPTSTLKSSTAPPTALPRPNIEAAHIETALPADRSYPPTWPRPCLRRWSSRELSATSATRDCGARTRGAGRREGREPERCHAVPHQQTRMK